MNIRLEQDISWSDYYKYEQLNLYKITKIELLEYEGKDISKLKDSEKKDYYDTRESYLSSEYSVKNNKYNEPTSLSMVLEDFYSEYLFIIIIFIFMISGPIVSQEFSKGTIKLLLIKPYSRIKILASKYITSLSSIFIAIFITFIFELIIGGIMFSFDSLSKKIVVYSSVTDTAMYISPIKYFILETISYLPQFIILCTLTFAASTIFNNTAVSIITGFVGYIGSNIILNLLGNISTKPIVKFFIGYNWNFSSYIFNKPPTLKGLTFGFSLIVCMIYLLILIIPTFIVFKKKDIKNV